jgi:hypothetical protein
MEDVSKRKLYRIVKVILNYGNGWHLVECNRLTGASRKRLRSHVLGGIKKSFKRYISGYFQVSEILKILHHGREQV